MFTVVKFVELMGVDLHVFSALNYLYMRFIYFMGL